MVRSHFMAAVLGLIVSDKNFNFSCFVHNHRFCFLQVSCLTVFALSGHRVLFKFGLQDTLSYNVLKKCATLQQYGMVAGFHLVVTQEQGTTQWSPSLSRSNTWPSSLSWYPSAHLDLVFELWRHLSSDAVLTPAISPITGRLVEGGSILFLPIQVQRTFHCMVPVMVLETRKQTNPVVTL